MMGDPFGPVVIALYGALFIIAILIFALIMAVT